jgi:hypothetical protein
MAEIKEQEKSKLLTNLLLIIPEKIEESVEFLVYDLIQVKITDQNVVVIL